MSRTRQAVRWGLLLVAAAWLSGCAAQVFERPLAVMLDREAVPCWRLDAARQAGGDPALATQYQAALESLLFDPGHPYDLRCFAVDELVRLDESRFRQQVQQRITDLSDRQTLAYVCRYAVGAAWVGFTGPAIRSLARADEEPDADVRPQCAAIEALHPGQSVEHVVHEALANVQQTYGIDVQVAAWTLVNRWYAPQAVVALLVRMPQHTPLVINLMACHRDLHALPTNREGVFWLLTLRDGRHRAFWEAAKARVAGLDPAQARGLELRHMGVLLQLDQATLQVGADQLRRRAAEVLARRTRTAKLEAGRDEQLLASLCWADLATLLMLDQAVRQPTVAAALFAQADADFADKSTEHGGVIAARRGSAADQAWQIVAMSFPPLTRRHDMMFLPSPEMIEQLYTSLAHYHFHAHQHDNVEAAGPGRSDLALADRLRANCLVFTFIDRDYLHVSYYQPGGIVIDLGTLAR
ncbi:MAG: hypothetical protein WD042_18675 [Phycisphaeraceae bacterium]